MPPGEFGPPTALTCLISLTTQTRLPWRPERTQHRLLAATSGALAAFAYTGDPNHDGLPDWPTYTVEDRHTMRFDAAPSVQSDPFGAERLCWNEIPLEFGTR